MVDVLPGPVAFITAADIVLCGIESTTLYGTATDNVGPLLWQWYANGTPISTGVVVQNLTVYTPGNYTFTILAENGCADTASLNIPGCSDTGSAQPCDYPIPTISHTDACNTIHLSGDPGASLSCAWSSAGTYPYYSPGAVTDFTTNVPGIFEFVFNTYYPGPCNADTGFVDTVWLVPDFTYRIRCASGGLDSVTLTDHSTYLSGCNVITTQWLLPAPGSAPPTSLGYGLTRTFLLYAGSIYTVIEKVTYSTPDGAYHECEITHTIVLPELPTVSFTISDNPICSEMPTHFNHTTTGGIVSYYWYFGDGSGSTLASPERAYEWHFPSDPNKDTVKVTVTDTIGCKAEATEIVDVRQNRLSGSLGGDIEICHDNPPVTLNYYPTFLSETPTAYLWSTGATTETITVDSSGTYWVTVYGPYSCQRTVSPIIVNIIQTANASIIGRTTYCSGDSVRLSGYVGLGASYQWYRDGSLISTASTITDGGLADGNYLYQLVRTVMDSVTLTVCTDTVADTVTIYALPTVGIGDPEAIDCDLYTIHLEANGGPGPGTYNWSNGVTGAVNENIHTGGG